MQDNVRTGSVLVRFDPSAIQTQALEATIISAADKVVGKSSKSPSLLSKKNINRYNKIAMLATLGASLGFAVARRKRWRRWHALTGYLFIANLGVHFYFYRKSLFRLFR